MPEIHSLGTFFSRRCLRFSEFLLKISWCSYNHDHFTRASTIILLVPPRPFHSCHHDHFTPAGTTISLLPAAAAILLLPKGQFYSCRHDDPTSVSSIRQLANDVCRKPDVGPWSFFSRRCRGSEGLGVFFSRRCRPGAKCSEFFSRRCLPFSEFLFQTPCCTCCSRK